jgi:hypothetical protein
MLDVLRERRNTYLEQSAKEVPHVLEFRPNWFETAASWSGQ